MSSWTHITGCLSVDTFIQDSNDNVRHRVKEILEDAPVIPGSEKDASIHIINKDGFNFSQFKGHKKVGEWQTGVLIVIQGDLRDTIIPETAKAASDFLKYIAEKFTIRDYAMNVYGWCSEQGGYRNHPIYIDHE